MVGPFVVAISTVRSETQAALADWNFETVFAFLV